MFGERQKNPGRYIVHLKLKPSFPKRKPTSVHCTVFFSAVLLTLKDTSRLFPPSDSSWNHTSCLLLHLSHYTFILYSLNGEVDAMIGDQFIFTSPCALQAQSLLICIDLPVLAQKLTTVTKIFSRKVPWPQIYVSVHNVFGIEGSLVVCRIIIDIGTEAWTPSYGHCLALWFKELDFLLIDLLILALFPAFLTSGWQVLAAISPP